MTAVKDGIKICPHKPLPLGGGHIGEKADMGYTGVINKDIHRAEMSADCFKHFFAGIIIAYICIKGKA